jgi:hypothetical protein
VTPKQLLAAATKLLNDAGTRAGWRAVAVAALTRQALEAAIDGYWARAAAPGAERAPRTTQLLCLPSSIDEITAEPAFQTWASLSGACHDPAYDLAPSTDELSRWLTDTGAVIAGLDAAA